MELENRLRRLAFEDGESHASPLSQEEFVQRYNIPPWDFVNQTLQEAKLDFAIDAPARYHHESYTPTLTKLSTGVPVQFNSLSSGENVLISFALCVYYANDKRQLSAFPKVLLFDEIDAPLHPSMSRTPLNTITNIFVSELGIHVILTTHSPSTVAVASPDSIHVMLEGKPGIHKVSKGVALNLMTDDVPTLAIGYDGRQHVFVESRVDAAVYDRLYQALKAEVDSERSLTFIAVGKNAGSGESDGNSGCDQVKTIVNSLVDAGNISVLGLIDWDTKNTSSDRVFVLAEGHRYSLENCLYDPLLLAATIARDAHTRSDVLGMSSTDNYIAFQSFAMSRLQEIAASIEAEILGENGCANLEKWFPE